MVALLSHFRLLHPDVWEQLRVWADGQPVIEVDPSAMTPEMFSRGVDK